jgi:uncharacterized protein
VKLRARDSGGYAVANVNRGAVCARSLMWLVLALIALLGLAPAAFAEPKFPELTGRIVDEAGLINWEDRKAIEAQLVALEAKSTDQIVVVTVKSLQGYEIEEFAYQLGRKWGIGQKDKDNGVLLVVAPNERKVRVEVGRRLEPLLPDGMTGTIIRSTILPAFRRGDFSGGIKAGVKDLNDVLLGNAEEVKQRAKGGGRPAQGTDTTGLIIFLIWVAIIVFMIWMQMRQARQMRAGMSQGPRRRRLNDGNIVIIPGGFGGGWSGGGGGDSGGGFSGGGGDFGGGGASGSW